MYLLSVFSFYLASIVLFTFGIIYLMRAKLMPYHEKYIGTTHENLPEKESILFSHVIRVTGGFFIGLSFLITSITIYIYPVQPGLAKFIILGAALPSLLPLLITTFIVGHPVPKIAVSTIVCLLLLGTLLG
jgi:hypothetical protein